LDTGAVVQQRDIAAQYFGEGITVWKSALVSSPGGEAGVVTDRNTFAASHVQMRGGPGAHRQAPAGDGWRPAMRFHYGTFAGRRRSGEAEGSRCPRSTIKSVGAKFSPIWQTDRIAGINRDRSHQRIDRPRFSAARAWRAGSERHR
jgi:hypothetical protein